MSDTILRQLETLRAIPRQPRTKTAREVHEHLTAAGYVIDRRSVERDLHRLSASFPITCDEGSRPVGWYWPRGAAEVSAPGLTTSEALQVELLARYLRPLLPRAIWATLQARVAEARATLASLPGSPVTRWHQRVAVIDDGQPLLTPEVAPAVIETVHECLLRGLQLALDYRAVESDAPRRFEVHPVALVYVGQVGYLVVTLWDYTDLRHLALHRMSRPEALSAPARQPANFDLDAYLREEFAFDFPGSRELRLVLRVSTWMARHLEERRLSQDQHITTEGTQSDTWIVRATVRESERLTWWLRSHGTAVEVLKPVVLRRRLAAEFSALAACYGEDPR